MNCRIVCRYSTVNIVRCRLTYRLNSGSASFSGVQTFSPFLRQFGDYNEKKATWALPTRTVSLMNSLPLLGKFLGWMIVGPVIEPFGHRTSMFYTCFCQIIGAVSEYPLQQFPGLDVWRPSSSSDKSHTGTVHCWSYVHLYRCGISGKCKYCTFLPGYHAEHS